MEFYLYRRGYQRNNVSIVNGDNFKIGDTYADFVFVNKVNGVFRRQIDVLNLEIELSLEEIYGERWSNFYNINSFNMIYIEDFHRWYDVSDVSIFGKIITLTLTVNTLYTAVHFNLLYNVECFVSRNEFMYDDLIIDDMVFAKRKGSKFISTGTSPLNIMVNNIDMGANWFSYTPSYILTTMGNILENYDNIPGGNLVQTPTLNGSFNMYIFNGETQRPAFNDVISKIISPDFFQSLSTGFSDLDDYISSVKICPINFNNIINNITGFRTRAISVGNQSVQSAAEVLKLTPDNRISFYCNINLGPINSFLDLEPYSTYKMFIPFYGVVDVPTKLFYDESSGSYVERKLVILLDIPTGDFEAMISNDKYANTHFCEYIWKGNMYCDFPFGSTNAANRHRSNLVTGINLGLTAITAGKNFAQSMSKGSKMRTPKRKQISKRGRAIQEKAKSDFADEMFNLSANTLALTACAFSENGSTSTITESLKYKYGSFVTMVKQQGEYYYPNKYNKFFGKPLNQTVLFNELDGYTEIKEIIIPSVKFIAYDEQPQYLCLYEEEVDDLREILASGFYI